MSNYLSRVQRSATLNNIKFTMLPYQPAITSVYLRRIEQVYGKEAPALLTQQVLLESMTIDIVADGDVDSESGEAFLLEYWQGRGRDVIENVENFLNVVPSDIIELWLEAWSKTRIPLPPAPEIIAAGRPDEDADPN